MLASGAWDENASPALDYKRIAGGLLVQDTDRDTLLMSDLKVVSKRVPDAAELRDLLFAWHVAMYVKSNAIVYARGGRTIGIGAGQMSRVVSAKIAGLKAAEDTALNCIVAKMSATEAGDFRANAVKTKAAIAKRMTSEPCPAQAKAYYQQRSQQIAPQRSNR